MLYLNSIENVEASPTEKKYAICHDEVSSMPNIPELAPSRELLTQWQSNTIDWEEFRERFTDEMRAEYRKEESRLKGLIRYSLENDVTLHSPEPSGEQTYRAILEGIINAILADKGQTDRVINLARKPVEELQPQEDIANLFGNTLHELNLTKDDNTRLLIENAELKGQIDRLDEKITNQQGDIQSLKDASCELEEQVNKYEKTIGDLNHTLSEKEETITNQQGDIQSLQQQINDPDTTIGALHQTLSKKKEIISDKDCEIQSLQTENYNRDKENTGLKRQVEQLKEETSTKEGEIKSLEVTIRNAYRENAELKTEIAQLQDISTHPRIRDIAIKATEDDSTFRDHFRTLPIDENYPETLIETLRNWLKNRLKTGSKDLRDLPELIKEYKDCDKFDQSDSDLAHVIRTQRNLTVFGREEIDERTIMGRALCCFFAAALLAPKLSQSNYTSTKSSKSIKPKSDEAEAHYNRGIVYRQNGDCDRAIAEYTKAIELKPNYADAYRNRGTAYYHKGAYDRAIAEYTKAIELRLNYADAYYDRGTAYYRKGDYTSAITEYTKAIELKPGYSKAYHSRGHAYKKKGDHARARADLDKVKQLRK